MLKLPFHQTTAEQMVRVAATLLFHVLLRTGYPLVRLSDLTEKPQYGFTASATDQPIGPKFVRITDLKDGKIDWETVPYCECTQIDNYRLSQGDILFARTGATTGKTHLISNTGTNEAVFASYLIRIRPKADVISPEYLYSFFQSNIYWSQILEEKQGSAQPNVNGQRLLTLQLPIIPANIQLAISTFLAAVRNRQNGSNEELPELPHPLDEQRRIVARIEALAGRVAEAQRLRAEALAQMNQVVSSLHQKLSSNRTAKLGDLLVLDEDQAPVTSGGDYPQVGVRGFGNGLFAKESISDEQTSYKHFNRLYEGALVLSQVKGWEGAIAVADKSFAGKFVSPEYRTFRCIPHMASPVYLGRLVVTPWFWTKLAQVERGLGGRRQRTKPEQFLGLEVLMPTYEQQLTALPLFQRLDALRPLQSATQTELDALLPAILDKAFQSEL